MNQRKISAQKMRRAASRGPKADQFEPLELRQLLSGFQMAFSAPIAIPDGPDPVGILAHDFNGDGYDDLAVITDRLNISLSDGHGGFAAPVAYALSPVVEPAGFSSLVSADFNGDGKADIAVANHSFGSVDIFWNQGNGTFGPVQSITNNLIGPYGQPLDPVQVVVADFNGDGKPDLGVENTSGNADEETFLLNTGNGNFAAPIVDAAGENEWMAPADFDGDGKIDFIAGYPGRQMFYKGNGDGTFAKPVIIGSVNTGAIPAIVDFNHDGNLDIAMSSAGYPNGSIYLFTNSRNATFAETSFFPPNAADNVDAADFNGDQYPDLIVNYANTSGPVVMMNNGDGTFASGVGPGLVQVAFRTTTGDFNGDGKVDIADFYEGAAGDATEAFLNQGTWDSSTALRSSNANSPLGQAVTFTATVTSTHGTPGGAVTFFDGSTTLGSSPLNGSGIATFTTSALGLGAQSISAAYGGDANHSASQMSLSETIHAATKINPVITWAMPAAILYGTALSTTQLNATASVLGNFAYTPLAGTILAAGNQSLLVTFTPTDTVDYASATKNIAITVNKATPIINWSDAPQDFYGTPLPASDLDARSATPGTFSYSPAVGAVLPIGKNTLTVNFTPTDGADYNSVSKSVSYSVILAVPTLTLQPSANPSIAGQNVTFTATVTNPHFQPTGTVQFAIGGRYIGAPVPLSGSTASFTATFSTGMSYVTATYSGDANTLPNALTIDQTAIVTVGESIPMVYPPTGVIDVANGANVQGWALDKDSLATGLTVRIDIDGVTAGTTTANLSRPDLVASYGSANHGFSYTMPTLSVGLHRIDVYALDAATAAATLIGSKEINTNQAPTGWIDSFNGSLLQGWAFDANSGSGAIQIRYSLDGNAPVLATANVSRTDLAAALGSANHGFAITLPALQAGNHTVNVWAVDPLTDALTLLGTRSAAAANPVGNALPRGSVDIVSATQVAGWAYDPSNGPAAINVRIDVDGIAGTPFLANLARADLVPVIGSKFHGFSRVLSLTPGAHRIAVYALDYLRWTPVLLGSQIVNDPAPRGSLDLLSSSSAGGWAYSAALGSAAAMVRVDIDGVAGKVSAAGVSRPDLTAVVGSPNHGFSIVLPKLPAGSHSAKIYVVDAATMNLTLIGSGGFVTT